MFCPKCGNELKPGAKFCAKCGAPQEPPSAPGPVNQGNTDRRETGKGAANPGPIRPSPVPEPANPRKKKGKGLLAAVLILLILAFLGAGGFAAYKLGVFEGLLDLTSKQTSVDDDDKGRGKKNSDDEEEPDDEDGEEDSDEDDGGGNGEEESGSEEPEETSPSETTEAEKIKLSELLSEAETTPPVTGTSSETVTDPSLASEGMLPVSAETSAAAASDGDYVIPDSSTRRISAAELDGLTKDQLKIARNEIYARHGRKFDSEVLQFYFNSKSWYEGTIEPSAFSEDLLSQVEKDNIKLIKAKEESMP